MTNRIYTTHIVCRYGQRRDFSFRNTLEAFLTLFVVLTLEGWLDIRDMLQDDKDATTWVRNQEEGEEEEGEEVETREEEEGKRKERREGRGRERRWKGGGEGGGGGGIADRFS